jgi:hypothetical protein
MILASPAADQVVTGVTGFLVVAGMAVVLFFLLRSMNKQLRKVVREPRWREEAGQGQGQEQEEQDYSPNGTARP